MAKNEMSSIDILGKNSWKVSQDNGCDRHTVFKIKNKRESHLLKKNEKK